MYIFKSSFLRSKDLSQGYQNIDVSRLRMSEILEEYVDGYIVLSHTHLKGTFYVTIEALRAAKLPLDLTKTFEQYLSLNHNRELPATKIKPQYKHTQVIYGDAIQSGFKVNRIAEYKSIKANTSDADKVDLHIQKNLPDAQQLYKRVLTSVNGFMHRCEYHENGLAIKMGGNTFNNTGINTVGILSFANCCDLRQFAITEDMLTPTSSTIPFYHEFLIHLGESIENKSVMISIGGHLFFTNRVCEVVNAEVGILMIKLTQLDIVKMLLNSVNRIDLDPLGIFAVNKKSTYNKVRVEEIHSDLCIKKYMCLPQSFIIVADAESIQTEYDDVFITGLPGAYECKNEPTHPLINSQGILCEYWKLRTEECWSMKLSDDITKRYMYATNIDIDNIHVNSMSPTNKWRYDDPRLIKITVTSKTK